MHSLIVILGVLFCASAFAALGCVVSDYALRREARRRQLDEEQLANRRALRAIKLRNWSDTPRRSIVPFRGRA